MQLSSRAQRGICCLRDCAIAHFLLLAFLFGGNAFLALMQLSEASFAIAGGVILFLIALSGIRAFVEQLSR